MARSITPRKDDTRRAPRRSEASGRFVLRIDPSLHGDLKRRAAERNLSLNEYCARTLASPCEVDANVEFRALLDRAVRLFGHSLAGVIVHGSWARGEDRDTSDIDVLVVLDRDVPVDRALYRRWDEAGPLVAEGRPVDVHFSRLPDSITALWAELAIDAVPLFDRDRIVSRTLARIRERIAAGRLARRIVHGQPYWTEVT